MNEVKSERKKENRPEVRAAMFLAERTSDEEDEQQEKKKEEEKCEERRDGEIQCTREKQIEPAERGTS